MVIFLHHDGDHGGHGDHGDHGDVDGDGLVVTMHHGDLFASSFNHQDDDDQHDEYADQQIILLYCFPV